MQMIMKNVNLIKNKAYIVANDQAMQEFLKILKKMRTNYVNNKRKNNSRHQQLSINRI